jgi:hypothetical protein
MRNANKCVKEVADFHQKYRIVNFERLGNETIDYILPRATIPSICRFLSANNSI